MAPLHAAQPPAHSFTKRQLSQGAYIGIALGGAVVLFVLLSIVIGVIWGRWRMKKPRLPRFDPQSEESLGEWPRRTSITTYWSADDIGKAMDPDSKVASVTEPTDKRVSKVVVLPMPTVVEDEPSNARESRVVQLPSPTLSHWSFNRDKKESQPPPYEPRPTSRHVRTWSKHISMQVRGKNRAAGGSQRVSMLLEGGNQHDDDIALTRESRITNLDWQEYRPDSGPATAR
jgi:hypothetical protein